MEPYILTQEDIDQLMSRDFDMRGVSVGTEAMPAEVEALGITAPAAAPADQGMSPIQQQYSAARAAGVAPENAPQEDPVAAMGGMPATTAAPAVAAAPTAAYGGANMMDLLSQPIPQDPFENLSRRQRTMLGFAALQDAGLALQGKQGSAFSNTLSGFRERADMERKRQAALTRQQMMTNLMGGGGMAAGAGALDTPEAIRGRIQQLTQFAMMNPSMAAGISPEIQRLQGEAERLTQAQSQLESTNMGVAAVDALLNSPDLKQIAGIRGIGNEWLERVGAAPRYSNLMSYVEQIRGLNFVEAYRGLKGGGPITDIEGNKATAARARVDRALLGTPEDLKLALQEVGELFQEAREKNPMYDPDVLKGVTPPAPAGGGYSQEEINRYLTED